MPITTTQGRAYLVTERSLERIEIQFFPQQIGVKRNASIPTSQVIGRNTPQYQYVGGETTVEFDIDFFSEDADRQDVLRKCRFLESLQYNSGFGDPPERVIFTFGKAFRNKKFVVLKFSYQLSLFDKVNDFMPRQARGKITLGLDPGPNINRRQVRAV